jgi:hypothetical protein
VLGAVIDACLRQIRFFLKIFELLRGRRAEVTIDLNGEAGKTGAPEPVWPVFWGCRA